MGSEFIKRGIALPPHIWSAQLNLDAPEVIYKIHREYINSGVDYIISKSSVKDIKVSADELFSDDITNTSSKKVSKNKNLSKSKSAKK